jgi:hypothetical protein
MLIPWLLVHGFTFGNHAIDLILQFCLKFLEYHAPYAKFQNLLDFKFFFWGKHLSNLDFQKFYSIWVFFSGGFQCIHFGNIENEGNLDTIICTLGRPCYGCFSKILVDVLFCFEFYVWKMFQVLCFCSLIIRFSKEENCWFWVLDKKNCGDIVANKGLWWYCKKWELV